MSTEAKDQKPGKKVLSLGGKLELKKAPEHSGVVGTVKQSFTHGRSKTVAVEVKKKREGDKPETGKSPAAPTTTTTTTTTTEGGVTMVGLAEQGRARSAVIRQLTADERAARIAALKEALEEEKRAPEAREPGHGP